MQTITSVAVEASLSARNQRDHATKQKMYYKMKRNEVKDDHHQVKPAGAGAATNGAGDGDDDGDG